MKTITKYLVQFAIVASVLTVIFRFSLSYGIENQSKWVVVLSSVIYGLAMFLTGLYFGQKDGKYLPVLDLGFRFHLATFLVHNVISYLWLVSGFASSYENINSLNVVLIIWGVILVVHFIIYLLSRKKTINNLDKEDLFD